MERLKTQAEKAAEITKLREERALEERQRKHQESQRLLQEFEKYKPYIIQLINNCTDIPVSIPREGIIIDDLIEFLDKNGSETINIWLKESGYEVREYYLRVDGAAESGGYRTEYRIHFTR